jgi:hypothetical protein
VTGLDRGFDRHHLFLLRRDGTAAHRPRIPLRANHRDDRLACYS